MFIFCLLEPGEPFALIAGTASEGAHLPEEPSEKTGQKVMRNISLKGFLLVSSLLVPGGDGLREQSLREDVMIPL